MKRIASLILGVLISIGGIGTSVYADTEQPIAVENNINSRTAYDWTNSYYLEPFRSRIVTGPVSGGRFKIKNAWSDYDRYVKISTSKNIEFRVRIEVENGSTYYGTGRGSVYITLPAIDSYYKVYIESYEPSATSVDVTVTSRYYPI